MLRLKISYIALLTTALSSAAVGYEVDDFTHRLEPLPDSGSALDTETNRRIADALQSIQSDSTCKPKHLYTALRDVLDSNPVGELESWAENDSAVSRYSIKGHHIYSGGSFFDGLLLSIAGIESSIRINGHVFGVDKLGHFMGQGYEYFEMTQSGQSEKAAMKYGAKLEEGIYGLDTTGVKSYGDMSANVSGLHFWQSVLGGKTPYFACERGHYVQKREFHWRDHASDAWDEGTNCSEFNDSYKETVKANLAKLKMTCPVEPARCRALAALPNAEYFISPACMAAGGAVVAKTPTPPAKAAKQTEHYSDQLTCFKELGGHPSGAHVLNHLDTASDSLALQAQRAGRTGFYVFTEKMAYFFAYPTHPCRSAHDRKGYLVSLSLPGESRPRVVWLEVGIRSRYQSITSVPSNAKSCTPVHLQGSAAQAMDHQSDALLDGVLVHMLNEAHTPRQDLSACRHVESTEVRHAVRQADDRNSVEATDKPASGHAGAGRALGGSRKP